MNINIGRDFSDLPSGRYFNPDGEFSGECFREKHLWPAVKEASKNNKVEVIMDDGVESYGSSFLTEAFAGIVKYGYMKSDELLERIELVSSNEDFNFYVQKTIEYIREAKFDIEKYQSTLLK